MGDTGTERGGEYPFAAGSSTRHQAGAGIAHLAGGGYAKEFFAGYITEYSLSVDNLFVFVIIMSAFAVPRIHQHKVLLFGILAALILRGLFIAVGAAAIAAFEWIFYF